MSILKSAVIITSVFQTTNTSAQIIEYKNSPLGIKYYTQDGHRIDENEVKLAISKDQNAFLHYDKFTINTSFSLAFGSVGGAVLGWELSSDKDTRPGLIGAGIVALATGYFFDRKARAHMTTVIDRYNLTQQNTSSGYIFSSEVATTNTPVLGLALTYNF